MLTELAQQLDHFIESSKQFIPTMLMCVGGLWLFNVFNWMMGKPFTPFGIHPRKLRGLFGIFFAPFLHANVTHLFFNSLPLFFLGLFLMALSLTQFLWATIFITIVGGFALWIIGRKGNHIGASGLIAGYFGYILGSAYQEPTFTTFFCAGIALYYFGSILLSLFPGDAMTSWEGHLTGFASGLLAILIYKQYDQTLFQLMPHFN